MPKFNRIIMISDGIRGHYHQSLGVVQWLERLGGGHLLEQLKILEHGFRIRVKVTSSGHESIGVDTPEDLRRVSEVMNAEI